MLTKTITNQPYSLAAYLQKLSKFSYLIKVLSLRELKIKYSNTVLGLGWLFLQPLVVVIVYSIFFKSIVKINSDNIPYPAFVFSGLVLWYLFTGIVTKCTYALAESADLINKVSFPRLIIIASKTFPTIIECFTLLVLLFVMLLLTGQPLGLNSFAALFYFVEIIVFSYALGLLASVLVIRFRDLGQIIPFAVNFGIWLTPVFYPVSMVPDAFKDYLRYLNPLALAMEGLRRAVFFNAGILMADVLMFTCSLLLLLLSFFYFVKFERKLVENL